MLRCASAAASDSRAATTSCATATSCTCASMSEVVRALDQRLTLRFDAPASGVWNMERDAVLLDECARGDSAGAVRLYGFDPPCLTLGRMQPESDVDAQACARAGVDVVRRPSGGRAVLHDQGVT